MRMVVGILLMGMAFVSEGQLVSSQQIGDTTFFSATDCNGNSISGTSMKIGDFTFHDAYGSDGSSLSGTSIQIGDSSFHDLVNQSGDSISGSSLKIGDTTFHSLYDTRGNSWAGTTTIFGKDWSSCNAPVDNTESDNAGSFKVAEFDFGEKIVQEKMVKRTTDAMMSIGSSTTKTYPYKSAAGIVVGPDYHGSCQTKNPKAIESLHAKLCEKLKNEPRQELELVAKISAIRPISRQVVLDTKDIIVFTQSEFAKVDGKWSMGDRITVYSCYDRKTDAFLYYELSNYGIGTARGQLQE